MERGTSVLRTLIAPWRYTEEEETFLELMLSDIWHDAIS